ncbi:glutamate-5-semialdehyde dehydrogenase, partial [Bacillus haynesii]|uniref:glutamate-5-semialdehyde dehydrogenase n=1 Tax=Bacillus haynesii TaxID=1925021 RepID=UPI00227DA04B
MSEVIEKAKKAKVAKEELVHQPTEKKNEALSFIAEALRFKQDEILAENEKDIVRGKEKGVSPALLDRLALTPERLNDMADAVMLLIKLEDPVGETLETIRKDNGLFIENVRVPLGVVGMIYEARPNVTVDAATLCLKTGNAVILRGSSSAINSNQALVRVIRDALEQSALPQDAVQLIEDTGRETAKQLFTLNDGLDVLIPRGGKNLIDMVVRESTVPVLETGAGNCHIFIDESAKPDMAEQVVINAKTQRPSVCNAIETVLIHKDWAEEHTKALLQKLEEAGVEIRGDEAVCTMLPSAVPARETDWETEFLAPVVSIKTVAGIDEAIRHIRQNGTR